MSRMKRILDYMLTKNKRILITSEIHERISFRASRLRWRKMLCPSCATETEMLHLDSAVTLSGIPTRRLIQLAEQGKIHLIETTSGHLLFCRHSLKSV